MAGIQDLLLAAQAKKGPFTALLEGATSSFGQSFNEAWDRGPERRREMREQEDRQRMVDEDKRLRAQLAGAVEDKTKAALKDVSAPGTPAHPGVRLSKTIARDPKTGYLREEIKVLEPKSLQAKEYIDEKGRARIGAWDPESGKVIKSADDELASGRDRGTVVSDLRKEFIGLPEVKDYITVNTAVRSMDALLNRAIQGDQKNVVALDQALVTLYNKMTDPTSVVRESEYARTPENLPIVNRISGAITKLEQGGAGLTNDDREALVTGAKIIANERGGVFNERRGLYDRQAQLQQADVEGVTGTIPAFKPYDLNARKAAPAPAGGTWTPEKEARYQALMAKKAGKGS